MAYKKRITKSVVLDSASPNSALDVMIDWIVNKFITDVPDLKIQKEIAYSAEGYKKFPVFSETNYFDSAAPCSKIVFIGKHSNSVGLCIFCYTRDSRYYLDICVLPSFDMMCVTPATYGDGYQNSAKACDYFSKFLRGYYGTSAPGIVNLNNIQTRLEWDITPSSDTSAINMNIVYAGGNYGYAYSINSLHTAYNYFQLAFTKQTRSASEPIASMWFMRTTPGIFDIDTQYELIPGTFSPATYNFDEDGATFTNMDQIDNVNDSITSHIMLLSNYHNKQWVNAGLHFFLLWLPITESINHDVYTAYFKWTDSGWDNGYLPPVIANYSDKTRDPALWTSGEWFPSPKESRIFLRRIEQPVTTKDYTYIYRMLIPSMTTPKAGTVYESGSAAYMALLDNSLTYGIKLA